MNRASPSRPSSALDTPGDSLLVAPRSNKPHLLARLGKLAFLFFLLKGLLWLLVPALLAYWTRG